MYVIIAQVHNNLFEGEADFLRVPTVGGEVAVLPHHEPFVTTVARGTVVVKSKDTLSEFTVSGGVLEVSSNRATLLL